VVAGVVVAATWAGVAAVVVARLRLAAVPHVAGGVVRSAPLVAERVVGAVTAVVATVVVAGLRSPGWRPGRRQRRGW
jgi:hypothetical protein